MKKIILFLLVLFPVIWAGSAAEAAIIVGRISSVEGQIYRYMDVDDSWVATSLQSPAGTQDILLTGDGSKAEIAFPNDQLVRLDENTEIEILNLDDDRAEFTLHSGLARFYNRSSSGKLIIETARGTATIEPGGAIDVRVEKKSVTVSASHGEAVFRSYQDGAETVEVISGSTSLEFLEKSIIAGIGPIDRKWDRWCGDREGVLAQNRMVRSEYLPESMQEYAYAMEPNGRWQRIYYRGYYYWAWKPHAVDVGWSPYTTGYWDDWHGSPVWIDYKPWGWATHHHGQWLNMYGAWLWTPYVHVSHVPGVTAIGFNITFGKTYRSHWHPGRVRWIAYNDNVGWLPLAPWETYYGYRKWGPRSVVLQRGASLSININLSSHRHINHAVIIPKHHLYDRKSRAVNHYNRVKIRNINKATIVKNYKPLPIAERAWKRKHSKEVTRRGIEVTRNRAEATRRGTEVRRDRAEATRRRTEVRRDRAEATRRGTEVRRDRAEATRRGTEVRRDRAEATRRGTEARQNGNSERKIETRLGNTEKARAAIRNENLQRKRERPVLSQRSLPKERTVTGNNEKTGRRAVEKKRAGVIENSRAGRRDKETEEKVVRTEQKSRDRIDEKKERSFVKTGIAARDRSQKTSANVKKSKRIRNEARQAEAKKSGRERVVKQNGSEVKNHRTKDRMQIPAENRQSREQVVKSETRARNVQQKSSRKERAKEERDEDSRKRQTARNSENGRMRGAARDNPGRSQRSGRDWYSASMNNRRSR